MAQHKRDGKRLVVTGCLAERYRDELKKEIPEIDAVLGTGEVGGHRRRDRGGEARGRSEAMPMRIEPLTFHRKPCRASRHRPSRPRPLPTYLYDAETPRVTDDAEALRLREDRRRLRLHLRVLHHPDAARRSTAAGPARRSSPRRGRWRRAASRNCCSSRRTRRSTASTARSAARWRRSCASSTPSTGSSGSGCSTSIRPRSPTTCWRRWRSATRSASTSTCRCSTRRPTS